MKIELRIDGMQVRMNQKANIAVTHSIADVQEPDNTSAGYSKSVEVPLIPANMRVFRFTNELYSKEQFNNELHTAEYIVDGNTVMSGVAQIDKITCRYDAGHKLIGGSFHVSIIGASFEWITNARRQLNELTSDETVTYGMEEVYKNSTRPDASLIKFFPVDRGAFWKEENNTKVPRTHLELKDYHPFFNVWKTLELIFKGYTIRTSMREQFESLYCSGYIPEQEDLSYIKEENDFKAGTLRDETQYITPDTVFGLFENLDNKEKGYFRNGVLFPGTRARPFSVFVPKNALTLEYEINIHYMAGVGPTSGKPLCRPANYADTFLFGTDRFDEYNNFLFEHRFTVEESIEYADKLISPAYIDDYTSFLVFSELSAGTISWSWIKFEITNRSRNDTLVLRSSSIYRVWMKFSAVSIVGDVARIYISPLENGPWTNIADAPNAHITIVRTPHAALTFSKTLRTHAFTLTPRDRHEFICKFKSSQSTQPSNRFSVFDDCSIRPNIGNYIGSNEPVDIATIGGTSSQLDFIAALRQMFNLMFYTNPLTKEVFIEPRTLFYNLEKSEMVDWRGKIDYSKEIEVEELGGDIGKSLKLAYTNGNEVVEYYNWKNRTELGAYSVPLLNKTADDTKEFVNTMFAPFLLRTVESVGMTLPQEKREKTQDTIDDVDMGITPIIGFFGGVVERTVDDGSDYRQYPKLIFQDASKAINLGFEDIDWMPTEFGLNQYYKDNISAYNVGRRITVYLKLTPQDVEAFQFPNRLKRDFRAVFLLNMDGEDVPCLLESIEDYNPASGASTKCVFISDPNLKLTGSDLVVITYDDVAIGRNNTLIGYRKRE